MCLAPKLNLPAAPPPPPTTMDRSVIAARDVQRRRQKSAGGYNGTLLTGTVDAPTIQGKTLLGA